jgi:hypothetical protein
LGFAVDDVSRTVLRNLLKFSPRIKKFFFGSKLNAAPLNVQLNLIFRNQISRRTASSSVVERKVFILPNHCMLTFSGNKNKESWKRRVYAIVVTIGRKERRNLLKVS